MARMASKLWVEGAMISVDIVMDNENNSDGINDKQAKTTASTERRFYFQRSVLN
jgi:hypothetical protein